MARFAYPEAMRRSYKRRLNLIVDDTRRRLRRLQGLNLSPAQFESAAKAIKTEVLLDHLEVSTNWFVTTMRSRSNRDFLRLTGKRPAAPDEGILREARLRQRGAIEALVDQLIRAAISHYSQNNTLRGLPIRPHRLRAAFYAQDQVGVIYNELTKARAQHAGMTRYVWVRTTSANPRDFHLERVGKTYAWGDVEDEPGVLPNCKCTARPIND